MKGSRQVVSQLNIGKSLEKIRTTTSFDRAGSWQPIPVTRVSYGERRVGRSGPGGQPRAIIQLCSYNCQSYGFTSPQTLMRNNPQKRRKILWRYLLILLFFLHLYLTHRDPRSIWTDVHCQVATWFIMDSAMRRKGLLSKDEKSLFYNFEKNFYSEIIIWHLFKKNIDLEGDKPILSLLWGEIIFKIQNCDEIFEN